MKSLNSVIFKVEEVKTSRWGKWQGLSTISNHGESYTSEKLFLFQSLERFGPVGGRTPQQRDFCDSTCRSSIGDLGEFVNIGEIFHFPRLELFTPVDAEESRVPLLCDFLWLYMYVSGKRWWPWRIFTVKLKQHKAITPYSSRACFNQDLQLHKTW